MIFKQETQILKCTFEKEHFSKVKAAFKDRWPVVYIIEDDEKGQAYIDAYSTGLSYIPNCGCKSSALFLNSK